MAVRFGRPRTFAWPQFEFAYPHVNKAASTSVMLALSSALGPEQKVWVPPSDWLILAVVRDPWERFLSAYGQKILRKQITEGMRAMGARPKMPFGEFLRLVCTTPDPLADKHVLGQVYRMSDGEGRFLPNLIVQVEHIDQHWPLVRKALFERGAMKVPDLRRLKARPDHRARAEEAAREYGWRQAQTAIRERYVRDYEVLGYE